MQTEATGGSSPLFLRKYLGEASSMSSRYGLADSGGASVLEGGCFSFEATMSFRPLGSRQ